MALKMMIARNGSDFLGNLYRLKLTKAISKIENIPLANEIGHSREAA